MKLLTIILTCIIGIALACPPPLDNPDFVGNDTHTTADLIEAAIQQGGIAWTDAVATYGNPGKPWPQDHDSYHTTIHYCYKDKAAYNDLSNLVNQALNLWKNKIGPAGRQSGHALSITEVQWHFADPQPWCILQAPDLNAGNWNSAYPSGTLVIQKESENRGTIARSSEGYRPQGLPDRHGIAVDRTKARTIDLPWLIAHEFGHVFGLWHEHQRYDRDYYLHFECKNLAGYEETKRAVEQRGEHTMEQVCKSGYLSYRYDFGAAEWSKQNYKDAEGNYWQTFEGPFDPQSIMLYASDAGIGAGKNPDNIFDTPLVKWLNPSKDPPAGRTVQNCYTYQPNRDVSADNVAGIKYIYP